uniref:Uncharacterized protein n=1 Tax=Sphaerodactylus townsendi TaxID=933632 RepID=A0ACB8G6E7_9SAUR
MTVAAVEQIAAEVGSVLGRTALASLETKPVACAKKPHLEKALEGSTRSISSSGGYFGHEHNSTKAIPPRKDQVPGNCGVREIALFVEVLAIVTSQIGMSDNFAAIKTDLLDIG